MKSEKETKSKKLPAFYIALCCCVLMIGIAGYFTQKHTEEPSGSVRRTASEKTVTAPVFSNDTKETDFTVPTFSPSVTAQPEETASAAAAITNPPKVVDEVPEYTESPEQAVMDYMIDNPDTDGGALMVSSEQPAFIAPVNGDVLEPFSDKLAYNSVLGDWRAHGGIDIACENGCSVVAVAQGEVERVYENAMGKCVEISHAGGFVTRYMGLGNLENLTEGKEVNSGEVIGTSGECKGENVTEPHIHFEMEKDGVAVNPSDYLPH